MKFRFSILIFTILFSSFCFAQFSLDDFRDGYCRKDSFVAEIQFQEISTKAILPGDFKLYCDENVQIAPFLVKNNEVDYFVYFDLPDRTGNCELRLKLPYEVDGKSTVVENKVDIIINDCYSINYKPAVIKIGTDKYNKIYVKNNDVNVSELTITADSYLILSKNALSIPSNEVRTFYVYESTSKPSKNIYEVLLGDYKLFILTSIIEETANETVSENISEGYFGFSDELKELNKIIYFDQSSSGPLEIVNNFDSKVNEVKAEVTGNLKDVLKLEKDSFAFINPGDKINLYVYINNEKNAAVGVYSGTIELTSKEGYGDSYSIEVEVLDYPEEETVVQKETFLHENSTADNTEVDDMVSQIIKINQTETEEVTSNSKLRVWSMLWLVLVLAFIIYLIYKFLNRKKETNFKDYVGSLKK
ncbi:MAG: hypothetical protein PHE43_03180 [Candidatus Nanoarchaeia archaeon]|nr:hypothetical protein [Candidatus Nanoarchaeia archaeon]